LTGLDGAPEAVLGTPGLLWRPPALGLEVWTQDWRQDNPRLHEGRRLARLLALRAVTFPSWNAVVLRAAALGSDLPVSEVGGTPASSGARRRVPSAAAALRGALTLDLLVRGFAWSGKHLGFWPRARPALSGDLQAWSSALATAERLGIWEEPDDLGRALRNLQAEAERSELGAYVPDAPVPGRGTAPGSAAPSPSPVAAPASVRQPDRAPPARTAVTGTVGPLRRFLIAAGDYNPTSAGPVALHLLCHRLNRLGYEATIAPVGPIPSIPALGITNPDWLTPLAKVGDRFERCVAIYPENVAGNPVNSPWVVRWLLHRPGYFSGIPLDAGADDLLVTWDRAIAPDLPVFSLPLIDLATYHPKGAPGHGRLLWVGKGRVPGSLDRTAMTEITRSWPKGHLAMANVLRSAELLVSCDWLSSLNDEARMCGTPVALAGAQEWAPGEPMALSEHEGPGAFACPDGHPTPEQLLRATDDCGQHRAWYQRRVAGLDDEIERFVSMINAHFDRVAARSLAVTGS
jgi:hypothetical protein